jgi:hypothetical protein
MQADAVTETGYYWQHRKNREPRIVHYHGDWFAVLGNDTPFEPQHIKGELIGPIKLPAADRSAENGKCLAQSLRLRRADGDARQVGSPILEGRSPAQASAERCGAVRNHGVPHR